MNYLQHNLRHVGTSDFEFILFGIGEDHGRTAAFKAAFPPDELSFPFARFVRMKNEDMHVCYMVERRNFPLFAEWTEDLVIHLPLRHNPPATRIHLKKPFVEAIGDFVQVSYDEATARVEAFNVNDSYYICSAIARK